MLVRKTESFSRLKDSVLQHYRRVYDREKRLILGIDAKRLERGVRISFSLFFALYVLDVFSTVIAFSFLPDTLERNLIFAPLFEKGFEGFVVAIFLKFMIILPLTIMVLLPSQHTKFVLILRVLKMAALTATAAAIPLYIYIVLINNIPLLISHVG